MEAVCRWNTETRSEILVFEDACWTKDALLFQAIKDTTFDNLVLQGTLKEEILSDLQHFFSSRAIYQRYHLPWKRGILFISAPGNGKTHTVKALINALDQPCLYVKSFKSRGFDDDANVRKVFAKARKAAPCLLVLEDLDSQLSDENRSLLQDDMRLSEQSIMALAEAAHDFSFAYLKELFLSSMMRWLAVPETGMKAVMREQMALLRTQMTSTQP